MTLGITRQQPARGFERTVMPDAGKNVERFALSGLSMADAARGQNRQRELTPNFDSRVIARFFSAKEMPLQLDVDVFAAEEFAKLVNAFACLSDSSQGQCVCERTFVPTGEADKASGGLCNFFPRNATLAFWSAQFHARDETAKIPI